MSFKNAIVLTGGIATGKSSVASILKSKGFEIIDADKIAHQMLDDNVDKILEIFGKEYISENRVDRKKLGELIFSNKNERSKLEKLLHPLIKKQIEKEALYLEEENRAYIIDIPLFYEKGNYDIDDVVLVYCPKDQQLDRLVKRDNINIIEAQKRIDAQMDIEKKKKLAPFVIDNSHDLRYLENEVESFLDKITKN